MRPTFNSKKQSTTDEMTNEEMNHTKEILRNEQNLPREAQQPMFQAYLELCIKTNLKPDCYYTYRLPEERVQYQPLKDIEWDVPVGM